MCINFSGNSPALFPKMERQPVGWKVHRLQPLTGPLKGHLSECPDPSSLFPERGSVSWSLQGRYRNSSVQSRDGAGRKPKKTANRSRNLLCVWQWSKLFTANDWCFHTQVSELLEEDQMFCFCHAFLNAVSVHILTHMNILIKQILKE